jgi:hypothetical protein
MSNAFNNFLGQVLQGAGNPKGQLADYAHASRLYVDNTMALAPKNGWIFYVVFNINQSALNNMKAGNNSNPGLLDFLKKVLQTTDDWKVRRQPEVGMLVKSTDLPKFALQTEVVNQYNRKTVIQKGITYENINMTFHDDMSNVTHRLWEYYYKYYYADSNYGSGSNFSVGTKPAAFTDTKYKSNADIYQSTNYGLNNAQVDPFFDSICIYQLNQKSFTSFILINPLITSWQHDRLDQSTGNKVLENKMTLAYETVLYGTGRVAKDNPSGFATFHYDLAPSPLSIAGGGNNSLFGPGGIISGAADVFGDISNVVDKPSIGGILGTALAGGNLIKNLKNVSGASLQGELTGLISGGGARGLIGTGAAALAGVGGLASAGIKLFKGNNTAAKTAEGDVQAKAADTNSTPDSNNQNPDTPPPETPPAPPPDIENISNDGWGEG